VLDVFDAVRTRRSIRRYEARIVEEEKLSRLLESARLSASANNNQPWHFVVVSEKAGKDRLFRAYPRDWFAKAPVVIVACCTPEAAWSRQDGETYWKVDTAVAVQNMILVAHELGLGTCWIGAFDEAKVKDALGIPKEVRVIALISLGYPAETKGSVTERKPLEEILHYERW